MAQSGKFGCRMQTGTIVQNGTTAAVAAAAAVCGPLLDVKTTRTRRTKVCLPNAKKIQAQAPVYKTMA